MPYNIYRLPLSEFHRYKTHLLSLDDESRYMRFGFPIKNETIVELVESWEKDYRNHKVFVIENDNLEVIGVAHISRADDPVELAFSVLKEHQGKGMGDALMERAIEYCQNRGINVGCMVCLGVNDKIKRLARKHNVLVKTEAGDSVGEVSIPALTAISLWKEYVEDNMAKLDHLGKAQRKFAQMFRFPLQF